MLTILIVSLAIFSRVIVHTPNFSPILSLALFAGIYLKGRQAVLLPVTLMVISDMIIGFYPGIFFTWASIALISFLGVWLKERKSLGIILGGSILSAVIFFLVSNFGAFLTMYPRTLNGLEQCYILAIPFFRSTFLSTIAYSLVFYAAYEWVLKRSQGSALARLI